MIERLYEMYHQELANWCNAMTGDRSLAEDLVQEQELKIVKGKTLENKVNVAVDRRLLAVCVDGIYIRNCARVVIAEDVSAEDLLNLLKIENCGSVRCASQQKNIVELICENVAAITDESDGEGLDGLKKLLGKKLINADRYVL